MHIKPTPEAQELFMQAYEEYKDEIFRHCYFKVFDREQALDLTQEAFCKTWEYIAEGKEIENVRAFLYRVSTNLTFNMFRKKKDDSLDAMQEAGFDPGAEDENLGHDVIAEEQVIDVLKQIEEPYRSAVVLRYIEGMPPAEIAEALGVSANVVSVRVNRGVSMLKTIIQATKHV